MRTPKVDHGNQEAEEKKADDEKKGSAQKGPKKGDDDDDLSEEDRVLQAQIDLLIMRVVRTLHCTCNHPP